MPYHQAATHSRPYTGDRRSPNPSGRITLDTRVIIANFFDLICGDDHPCITRSVRLRTIVHSPVRTASSPEARRHPGAGSPAWLSSPTSSWPCALNLSGARARPALLRPAACAQRAEPHHVSLRASRHPLARDIALVQCPVREHSAGERLRARALRTPTPPTAPNAALTATALPATSAAGKAGPHPVQPAGVSRSSGVPTTDNPCCPVPAFHRYTDGQITVRRS